MINVHNPLETAAEMPQHTRCIASYVALVPTQYDILFPLLRRSLTAPYSFSLHHTPPDGPYLFGLQFITPFSYGLLISRRNDLRAMV